MPQTNPTKAQIWASITGDLPYPTNQAAVRNVVFYAESDIDGTFAGSGQSFAHLLAAGQRSREAANIWNQSTLSALIYRPYWITHVVVHEMLHTFGAVNKWTPEIMGGSGAGHCTLAHDVMCYYDGGEFSHRYPVWGCPGVVNSVTLPIDCLKQSFFRADHGDGLFLDAWLDVHWNTIGAENRFVKATPPWDYTVPCDAC